MPQFLTDPLVLIAIAVLSYLLGSVAFGPVIARFMGLGDLRAIGSGNIGATNVLRTGSKTAAFLTLIFDAGKGAVAVLVARAIAGEDAAQAAGGAAFLGHLFPIWLKFRGGKGVATYLGTLLALSFPVGIAACATWVAGAAITRISSMGALTAAVFAGIWALVLGYGQGFTLIMAMGILVLIRHHSNIRRIAAGTEPRIGRRNSDGSDKK